MTHSAGTFGHRLIRESYPDGHNGKENMQLTVAPKTVAKLLLLSVALLVLAHVAVMIMKHGFGHGRLLGMSKMFNLRVEGNVPTLYASLTLFLCACILFLIGKTTVAGAGNKARHWYGLAVIFLFLCADEYLTIHESIGGQLSNLHPTKGMFLYAWVIPYAVLVGAFALAYFRFLMHLPVRFRIRFVAAGAVYVTGALALEMFGAQLHFEGAFNSLRYDIVSTSEETLELLGATLFLIFLVQYAAEKPDGLVIRFDSG